MHWTASNYAFDPTDSAWILRFDNATSGASAKSNQHHVRLVRGEPWVGQRYVVTTAAYLVEGTNNAVIDRKTGLTWRRCLEGQFWSGSACTGSATTFNHQNALTRGNNLNGWRLPNVKELASLADLSRNIPGLDDGAFPGQGGGRDTWSSTPATIAPVSAGYVAFSNGYRGTFGRGMTGVVQLVQDNP
jgi:hypothetical protein